LQVSVSHLSRRSRNNASVCGDKICETQPIKLNQATPKQIKHHNNATQSKPNPNSNFHLTIPNIMAGYYLAACIALLSAFQCQFAQAAPIDVVFVHGLAGFGADELL
jgi:hypothetical protein